MLLLVLGALMLVALPPLVREAEEGHCEHGDHPGPCADTIDLALPGAGVLAVGTWCMAASSGLRRGRRWARWAVIGTFSLFTLGALSGGVAAASAPDGPLIGGLVFWLLLLSYSLRVIVATATDRAGD